MCCCKHKGITDKPPSYDEMFPPSYEQSQAICINVEEVERNARPSCTKLALNLAGRAAINIGLGAFSALNFGYFVAKYLNSIECNKKYTYCSDDFSPTVLINKLFLSIMDNYDCEAVDYECIFRVKIIPTLCSVMLVETAFTGMKALAPTFMPSRSNVERLAVAVGALSIGLIGSS